MYSTSAHDAEEMIKPTFDSRFQSIGREILRGEFGDLNGFHSKVLNSSARESQHRKVAANFRKVQVRKHSERIVCLDTLEHKPRFALSGFDYVQVGNFHGVKHFS